MFKRLLKDSFYYTASAVLTRGLSFVLLPLYVRTLSTEEFGILDYLSSLGSFVAVTVALEIAQAVVRFMPTHTLSLRIKRSYASTALWFSATAYLGLILLVLAIPQLLSQLLFDTKEKADLLVVACVSYALTGLLTLVLNQLRAELKSVECSALSFASAFATVAFTSIAVLWLKTGVFGALVAQACGTAVALVPAFFISRATYGLDFDMAKLREMLQFSMPLIPSSIGVMLALYIDRIAIKDLMSLSEVGVYGFASKIALIVSIALIGFRSALTPLIYTHHEDKETPQHLANIFRMFVIMSLMVFSGLSVFAHEITALLAPPAYTAAANLIPALVLAVLFSNMYIFAPGLELAKRTSTIATINLLCALVNVILNFTFIPIFGLMGSALATLTGFCLSFVAYMWYSQKLYRVPHHWRSLGIAVVVTVPCAVLVNLADIGKWQDITLKVACLIFTLVILYGLHLQGRFSLTGSARSD